MLSGFQHVDNEADEGCGISVPQPPDPRGQRGRVIAVLQQAGHQHPYVVAQEVRIRARLCAVQENLCGPTVGVLANRQVIAPV